MSQKPIVQKSWDLLEDGLLWKEVVKNAGDQKSFHRRAEEFVKQLQRAAKPKNALEGLLLDRMASGYLRKVMLLEEVAAYRDHRRARARAQKKGSTPEEIAEAVLVLSSPSRLNSVFEGMMQYESILDRGFHRDAFLLLQLQELFAEQTPALPPQRPAKANGKTIDGDAGTSIVG